ncbi:MAG: antitermination protein NusG [Bacteroidetes bacterium]|nr:MAG: antitermination protein NusG [Bacteroidota bacterium]
MSKEGYKWRVIYTKSRQEKKVAEYLTERGITHYLPTIKTLKQWKDRKKMVEDVLFKSYIFVNLSEKEYYEALTHPGAVKYVSFEGKAASMPDSQMEIIKTTIENKLEFDISNEHFAKGSIVKIANGPLKGTSGEIVSLSGKKKLLIRINEIGYSLLVHLSPAYLQNPD